MVTVPVPPGGRPADPWSDDPFLGAAGICLCVRRCGLFGLTAGSRRGAGGLLPDVITACGHNERQPAQKIEPSAFRTPKHSRFETKAALAEC